MIGGWLLRCDAPFVEQPNNEWWMPNVKCKKRHKYRQSQGDIFITLRYESEEAVMSWLHFDVTVMDF